MKLNLTSDAGALRWARRRRRVKWAWWHVHDFLMPALPRRLKPCHCRSYHERTRRHVEGCPRWTG